MVLTQGQQSNPPLHNCRACKHALIAAERAMKTASSDENYGALPSSYRKLRKSKSMVTPSLHRSRNQSSPILRLKRSLSKLKPAWKGPGKADPGQITPTQRSRFSSRRRNSLNLGNRQPGSWVKQTSTSSPSAGSVKPLERPRTRNGEKSKPTTEQKIPILWGYAHYFDFQEYERRGIRLSSREKFRIAAKRVQTRRRHPSITREDVERHGAKKQELSLKKKSNSSHTQEDNVTPVKRVLIKKFVLHPQQTGQPCRSDEPTMASGFDQYDLNDEDVPHGSNSSFAAEQDEAVDTHTHDLHSASSRESLQSNARSRVTSWTNSSMTGSVALRSGPLDRNRLSVIKEDGGPHQPSSSAGRHIGGVSLFQEPLQSTTSEGQNLPPIDSQRIYSALIKRIEQEEAEIEETTAALESVNLERRVHTSSSSPLGPTIRMVKSEPSINDGVYSIMQQDLDDEILSRASPNEAPALEQYEWGMRGVEQHLPGRDIYPSFLPFSFSKKSTRSGPFRKVPRERHKFNDSSVSSRDDGSIVVNRQSRAPRFGRTCYGNSSESIYSRATNELSNEDYISPDGSFASMSLPPTRLSKSKSMMEPMHTMRIVPRSTSTLFSVAKNVTIAAESKAGWNIRDGSTGNHVREQAQIHSEDSTNKCNLITSESWLDIRSRSDVVGLSVRNLTLKSMPGNRMKTLFRRATSDRLRNYSQPRGLEDKQINGMASTARRLQSDSIDVQATPSQTDKEGYNKENCPVDQNSTPPLSTPGRLQRQFRNGSRNGKLRKRASEVLFNSRKGMHSTPTSNPQTGSRTFSGAEESPAQRAKSRLVARLSRPFDMDVPPHNRPFDSMYLGKRTPGHGDTLGNSRLSVAPRASKSYGGLRTAVEEIGGEPALAVTSSSSSISRNASKVLGLFGSKRMVSNFLKSRGGGGEV